MDLDDFSYLTPYGYQSGSCGYCKNENTGGSYYARSTRLTVDHYQDLVDRGWRRSGETLYKPDVQRSCCPHYTIRLPLVDFKTSKHQRKTIQQWTRHVLGPDFTAETAKLHPPKTRDEKRAARAAQFDLVSAVHAPEADRLPDPSPRPAHRYEVTLEPDSFTEEKYDLFEQYQRLVHHEKPSSISRRGFRGFLCDSPLVRTTRTIDGVTQELGSFHQLHRLDGKLIALSVLDLLPHAVSAVYFIYLATPLTTTPPRSPHQPNNDAPSNPDTSTPSTPQETDFSSFSPGRLSALREAALAKERNLRFYYMGFYIHTCPKMRYKADFRPQYVLDPAAPGHWDPFDGPAGVAAALDAAPFVSMSMQRASSSSSGGGSSSDDADAAAAPRWPAPAQAERRSLFALRMPGVLGVADVRARVDLDAVLAEVSVQGREPVVVPVSMLSTWDRGDEEAEGTLKGVVAELVAAVGEVVAAKMVFVFPR